MVPNETEGKFNHHFYLKKIAVKSIWNVMTHGDAREGKWRGNWRMEWVASNLHTTMEHVVSSITTADAHTSASSSRLNCRPCRFKWTRPFCRKTKSGFCACPITFQTHSTTWLNFNKMESKIINSWLLSKERFKQECFGGIKVNENWRKWHNKELMHLFGDVDI